MEHLYRKGLTISLACYGLINLCLTYSAPDTGQFVRMTVSGQLNQVANVRTVTTNRKLQCAIFCESWEECLIFSVIVKKSLSGSTSTVWECRFSDQLNWNISNDGSYLYTHVARGNKVTCWIFYSFLSFFIS